MFEDLAADKESFIKFLNTCSDDELRAMMAQVQEKKRAEHPELSRVMGVEKDMPRDILILLLPNSFQEDQHKVLDLLVTKATAARLKKKGTIRGKSIFAIFFGKDENVTDEELIAITHKRFDFQESFVIPHPDPFGPALVYHRVIPRDSDLFHKTAKKLATRQGVLFLSRLPPGRVVDGFFVKDNGEKSPYESFDLDWRRCPSGLFRPAGGNSIPGTHFGARFYCLGDDGLHEIVVFLRGDIYFIDETAQQVRDFAEDLCLRDGLRFIDAVELYDTQGGNFISRDLVFEG